MRQLFVVTALLRDGDWILGAEVGEANPDDNTWKMQPRRVDLEALIDLIERPEVLVTSRTRSGTAGPNLTVKVREDGARTVEAIKIPGVFAGLESIQSAGW